MRKIIPYLILLMILSTQFLIPAKKDQKLSSRHKKWLGRDVLHIITKVEKSTFMQLETDEQRDMFILAFWKNRDPNHNTLVNEYKEEHYKRLKYAINRFGRGTPTPGWKTERGRIYITLGRPSSILRYEHDTELRPVVIWYYQGLAKYGLPNAFNVVFFKPYNSGDFELYSPIQHGPGSLLLHYKGDKSDTKQTFNELAKIDPDVAKVSLNLIEGESLNFSKPTMASDILIQKKVVEAPTKKINTAYASKLLKYKEHIDMEYSANYIQNSSKINVIRQENGVFFVHYLIEPKKLSLEKHDDKLFSTLEVIGSAINEKKQVVYSFTKKVPVTVDVKNLASISNKLFSFQDLFPIIKGKYDINILIRNAVSKEFTSMEKRIVIPDGQSPVILNPILSYNIKNINKDILKPFMINNRQLILSPKNDFTPDDKLHIYFQVLGLSGKEHNGSKISVTLKNDKGIIKNKEIEVVEFPVNLNIFESFDLKGLKPSYYEVQVELITAEKIIAKKTVPFVIPLSKKIKRAWGISLSNIKNDPYLFNTLGNQYVNAENYKKGYEVLRSAYYKNSWNPVIAYDYCRLLLMIGQHRKNISIGTKFLKSNQRYKFYQVLGLSLMALEDYEKAIEYFRKILDYSGTNIDVLNSIGESYKRLGKNKEALVAWERSLQIMPQQKELPGKIESLKKGGSGENKK
ncbi:MAG: GWxTD domain-containing protein [Acidobacteriota bacterium]